MAALLWTFNPFTGHLDAVPAPRVQGEALEGPRDGSNRMFNTALPFVHDPDAGDTIAVYHCGRRLRQAPSPDPRGGEYYVSESAGPGTGYDTVVMTAWAPRPTSELQADYTPA